MHAILVPPNLSHIDCLDDPAAIYWGRLIFSCTTKDVSPNEYIDPEISMKNHNIFIYSFGGSWPAIFPASIISLLPV